MLANRIKQEIEYKEANSSQGLALELVDISS